MARIARVVLAQTELLTVCLWFGTMYPRGVFSRRCFRPAGRPIRAARAGRIVMDALERKIINGLQGGFRFARRPFLAAAEQLGIGEEKETDRGTAEIAGARRVSRFGPLYHAEKNGRRTEPGRDAGPCSGI